MTASQLLFTVIKGYTRKKKTPEIHFSELTQYLEKCVLNDKDGSFDIFSTNTSDIATAALLELEKAGRIEIEYSGNGIETIIFPAYYSGLVEQAYKRLEDNPNLPFPDEQSVDTVLPNDVVQPVDIKSGFISLLSSSNGKDVIRVTFPGDIRSVLLTDTIVRKKLLSLSLQKLRSYINTGGNSNFVFNRLKPVVGKNEQLLKDFIRNLRTNIELAVSTVQNPTAFSYSFWAHLSNLILREFREKENKLSNEHDYCRAAYFIGYYNQWYQQCAQKEKDRVKGLKKAEELITKPPYVFSISDIYAFRDEQGPLLDSRYSKKDLTDFLAGKLRVKDESELLPELVRLKTKNDREYYVHREMIVPLILKKIDDAAFHYRQLLIDEWTEALRAYEKRAEIDDDAAFERFLSSKIDAEDPLMGALYSYERLDLAARGTKKGASRRGEMSHLFTRDSKSLVPLSDALRLKRPDLVKEAKKGLPLWRSIPLLGGIILFFKRMAGVGKNARTGKEASPSRRLSKNPISTDKVILEKEQPRLEEAGGVGIETPAARNQRQHVAFRKAVHDLKEKYSAEYGPPDKTMGELIHQWNKLLDPGAKKDLVEDVNSLTRDYLRSIKRSLAASPPDKKRISSLADTLIANKALSGIKEKEPLKEYLELYMVKILSEKQLF